MTAPVIPFPSTSKPDNKPAPFYLVEVYYGDEIGSLIGETEVKGATFEEAVRVVRDDDHSADEIARIIEVNLDAGTCLDVSDKVAQAICEAWDEDDTPSECLQGFLERHDCLPLWRDEDDEMADSFAEHRIGTFEAGVGRYR